MASKPTLVASASVDPQPSHTDQVRDAIASRAQRMDERFPKACDLEAAVLVAMAGELRGAAAQLSGVQYPEHFREMLRGERTMPLGELTRLATSPHPMAKAAAQAALTIISNAAGERGPSAGTLMSRAADLVLLAATFNKAVGEAQADSKIVDAEARLLLASIAEQRRSLDAAERQILQETGR